MPVTWDEATDKKFLLSIIHVQGTDKLNWSAIKGIMGDDYTLESIKTRFKRLKQQSKVQSGEPETPTASKGGKAGKKTNDGEKSTRTKRKSGEKTVAAVEDREGDDQEDDDEELVTLSKKKVKQEAKEESDGDLV